MADVAPIESERASSGLPLMPNKSGPKPLVMFAVLLFLPLAIGFGVAVGIFYADAEFHRANLRMMPPKRQWVYLGGFIFSLVVRFINLFPAIVYKSRIMTADAGNLRANMYIYKVVDEAKQVVLETEGDVGAYNRANRSLHHMVENIINVALSYALVCEIFPCGSCILMVVILLGRVMHQVGYSAKGYGGHSAGFAFSLLGTATLEGLLLVAFIDGGSSTF